MTSMSRQQLAALLRDLADKVETGDSLEGSLTYTYGAADGVEVACSVRVGNLDGQGSVVLL